MPSRAKLLEERVDENGCRTISEREAGATEGKDNSGVIEVFCKRAAPVVVDLMSSSDEESPSEESSVLDEREPRTAKAKKLEKVGLTDL